MTASGFQAYATDDLDEAVAIGSQLFYRHDIAPVGAHPAFSFRLGAARIGTIMVGELRYGCAVSVDVGGLSDTYGVSIPDAGALDLRIGRHELTSTPDAAAIVGPVGEMHASGWAAEDECLSMVRFDRRTLEAELGRLVGVEATGVIEFPYLLDLRSGPGADWYTYARTVLDAVGRSGALATNRMIAAQVSSILMTGLLLAADHQYRTTLDAPAARPAPATVRRAVRFIEENAQLPITVPDIASAVGASVRAINRGFKEHLGTTPLAYLIRVRMDGAHRDLLSGDPELTSVSQIAATWGFAHFGRFSARYRALYGSPPSEALRSGSLAP